MELNPHIPKPDPPKEEVKEEKEEEKKTEEKKEDEKEKVGVYDINNDDDDSIMLST